MEGLTSKTKPQKQAGLPLNMDGSTSKSMIHDLFKQREEFSLNKNKWYLNK